ncbi:8259_t:CDS:10 [Gigaspora rosea]|nr:8259_t:CDS:10 [Gigaspora rosea]
MVLQYCIGKNLREHLKEIKDDFWPYKQRIATEIATGMKFIHAANIVHCDLTKDLKTFLTLKNRENPINLNPVDYKELYCDSWNPDPKKRPSIEDVIRRLNEIEFENVYQKTDYIPEISLGEAFRKTQSMSKDEACLLVIKGSSTQDLHIFLPPGKISLGRGNSNHVIIRDQEIAKEHASIIVSEQGVVEINELGTESGISINGEKLGFRTSRLLIRDDVISMGRSEFQYLPTGEYKSRIDIPLSIYNKDYFLKKLKDEFKNSKENERDLSLLYGGDEFTILLKDTNKMDAFKIAEKIRSSVEAHFHSFNYNKKKLSVTLSIGVSEMNSSVKTYDDLRLQADNASKKAKEKSHNKSTEDDSSTMDGVSFSPTMDVSLSPTMDAKISITIIKMNSKDRKAEYYINLSSKETLNVIRNELETCDDFHMGANCYFIKNKAQILRKNESGLKLLQIIETNNEWFCNSLKLSRINSEQPSTMHMRQWRPKKEIIISDISATDEFIKDVKAALKNNEEDLVKQLRELSESYGHFYAERLILGGAIVKHKSYKYSQGMKSWDESLKDESTLKIIGYDKIYSLFELLDKDLKKDVLNALGHRILKAGTKDISFELKGPYIHHYVNKDKNTPVIVVNNIMEENSMPTTKLGWIIVGPLTNFNFNVQFPQFPLAFRKANSQSSIDFTEQENSQLNSASSLSSTEVIPYPIDYDPMSIEIIIGAHFSTYKESACLFVYDLKDLNKQVDEAILQNLALYTCVVDVDVDSHEKFKFGQMDVKWQRSDQRNISYAKTEIKPEMLSDNDLMLVSQLLPTCKHGFVNVNSNTGHVIYKSIKSEFLDSVGNIAYLLVSSRKNYRRLRISIGTSRMNSSVKNSKDLLTHAQEAFRKAKEYGHRKMSKFQFICITFF